MLLVSGSEMSDQQMEAHSARQVHRYQTVRVQTSNLCAEPTFRTDLPNRKDSRTEDMGNCTKTCHNLLLRSIFINRLTKQGSFWLAKVGY